METQTEYKGKRREFREYLHCCLLFPDSGGTVTNHLLVLPQTLPCCDRLHSSKCEPQQILGLLSYHVLGHRKKKVTNLVAKDTFVYS